MSEVKMVRRWVRPHAASAAPAGATAAARIPGAPMRRAPRPEVVAIGASTGGPLVLQTILGRLRPDFPAPILIVQHIAAGFLQGLVDWLTTTTGFPVRVAGAGERTVPGHAYLAARWVSHGRCRRSSRRPQPRGTGRRAAAVGGASLRIRQRQLRRVFRGRAPHRHGKRRCGGIEIDAACGALTIAQDLESSLVFGMPGEAVKLDAAAYILKPERIAAILEAAVNRPIHMKGETS